MRTVVLSVFIIAITASILKLFWGSLALLWQWFHAYWSDVL